MKFHFPQELFNDSYIPMLNNTSRYMVLYGGAGSGKSVFAAQKILIKMLSKNKHKLLFVRKVQRTIKGSQIALFLDLLNQYNISRRFTFRTYDLSIECENGNKIVSAGLDDVEKLKSIHGITGTWIEEATELDKEDFNQLDLRLRGNTDSYKQHILSFNPINDQHWLKRKFFDSDCDNAMVLRTTYKDNSFIDNEYKALLENQEGRFRNVYTLGEWGQSESLIYPKYTIYDELPEDSETLYGLDFGYENPSALVQVNIINKSIYAKELLYESKLTPSDLIAKLKDLIPNKSDYIIADSADPAMIAEIEREGFNIRECLKGAGSVNAGINKVLDHKLYLHCDSKNLLKEIRGYERKQDRNGNILEEPVKLNDHACLIAGTQITTLQGDKPIEDISIGDYVLTRKGYRCVMDSALTGYANELYKLDYKGNTLIGTGNHNIIIQNNEKSLKDLMQSDILCVLQDNELHQEVKGVLCCKDIQQILRLMVSHSNVAQMVKTYLTENIIEVIPVTLKTAIDTYTMLYGNIQMAKYPKAVISTIKTLMLLVTQLTILNAFRRGGISDYTLRQMNITVQKKIGNALVVSGHLQSNGINQKKVNRGIVNTQRNKSAMSPKLFTRCVSNAGRHIGQLNYAKHPQGSVATNAVKPAAVRCEVKEPVPVYNLTIEDRHEYYANGILVANCDSLRYAVYTYYNKIIANEFKIIDYRKL